MRISLALCLLFVAAISATNYQNLVPTIRTFNPRPLPASFKDPRTGRIVGGTTATHGQLPFQVALILDFTGFCGGSLITDTVVLTAGHCALGRSEFDVHLGAQELFNELEEGRVIVQSSESVIHENFNPLTLVNDIAIIILQNPVSAEPYIKPVRLPARSEEGNDFAGVGVRFSGWGRPADNDPALTSDLRYADTVVMSNEFCSVFYDPGTIDTCHLCFDTLAGMVGICSGDSGGPLVMYEGDAEATLIGVTSFLSSGGCEDGLPHGCSRLTCHLDWLETHAGVTIRP